MKVGFSLLHYNNVSVTIEAVGYLKQLVDIENAEIVIVDNASPNGSGKQLQALYMNDSNIHVILNEKNGGFAYGNNIGYRYAKDELGCSIILVMNNDIFIKDTNFISKLVEADKECSAEIIAPNIIGRKGAQNPFRLDRISDQRVRKMYRYNTVMNLVYHVPGVSSIVAYALDKKNAAKEIKKQSIKDGEFCIPHGACVIYRKPWINQESIAFVPDTFMYFEEDVLGEYMAKKGYTASYSGQLTVYHVEDASVEYDNKTSVKKRKFISGCMKKSIKVLINIRKGIK